MAMASVRMTLSTSVKAGRCLECARVVKSLLTLLSRRPMRLPMANCCADPLSAILRAMAPHRAGTLTPEPLRVLLVEDNAEAADLVRVYLTGDQDEAFQVDWVSNLLD